MSFDVDGARKAGYSEAEIADYLGQQQKFDVAGARTAGYSDAEILGHLGASSQPKAPKPQERSMLDSLGRQVGLTVRAGIGGPAAFPNAIADPVVGMINRVAGTNLPIPSQALERTMTRAGLPEPQGGPEEFAQAVARGMTGPTTAAKVLPQFASNMGMQTAAAGMGAGSADIARQAGAGPMGQFVAGVAGGVAPTTAASALASSAQMAKNVIPGIAEPLTQEGRRRIAARAVQGAASDKDAAARAAQDAPEYVPGSKPTLGEASNDIGLGIMEKAVRNRNPEAFATREAERDAARQSGLQRSFGTPTDITMAQEARNQTTTPMREAAFADAKPVNTKPIVDLGNSILNAGAKYRGSAGTTIKGFVDDIKGIKDPQVLYNGPRKAINDVLEGKASQDTPLAQFTKSELLSIKAEIDRAIEKSAPGFKDYLNTYSGMSREIDKARLGQDIAAQSKNPITERLSPAQYTRQFEKRGQEIANAGPVASDTLSRVAMDLRRSAAPMAAGRTPGSDTLQNLVANNMLQRAGVGGAGPVSSAVTKATGLLYKPFGVEDATQQIIRDAFLSPEEGVGLLSMQLKQNPMLLSEILARLKASPYGGLLGAGIASQQPLGQ
jgi:hypothetical protein